MTNFKDAAKTYAEAETVFMAVLIAEVKRLAVAVIMTHPAANSFCMAMGSASFGCQWEELDEHDPSDKWDRDENLDPGDIESVTGVACSYATDLQSLLDTYDSTFCLTGYPIMITMDGPNAVMVADW